MTYSGLYLRADEKIFKLQICISEWINVLSFCFVHTLSEQRSTRKRIQHWVKQPQFCIKFNGEEHLNRFSCNFFRQFKYTIAGVLPIVSALWQMNSRNFLQVKGHQIKRPWEPEKKKIQTKYFVTSNFRSHLNKLKRMWMNSCSSLSQWFLVCYIQLQKGKMHLISKSVKDKRCILHR